MKVLVAQCPTVCNPMDWNPLGSSVHGISQARILEWVAISSSRGSSQPRDWTCVSCIAGRFFTAGATRVAHVWANVKKKKKKVTAALNVYQNTYIFISYLLCIFGIDSQIHGLIKLGSTALNHSVVLFWNVKTRNTLSLDIGTLTLNGNFLCFYGFKPEAKLLSVYFCIIH